MKPQTIKNWNEKSIPKDGHVFNCMHSTYFEYLNCETGELISVRSKLRGGVPDRDAEPEVFEIATHPNDKASMRMALLNMIRERVTHDILAINNLITAMREKGEIGDMGELTREEVAEWLPLSHEGQMKVAATH